MNAETATDRLYEAVVNLTARMYPGQDLNDTTTDVGIVKCKETTGDPATTYIQTHDQMVEAWAWDRGPGRGIRSRFAFVVLPVYGDDVGEEMEFSNAEMAAKAILCLHLQMRLASRAVSFKTIPRLWPTVRKGKQLKSCHEGMVKS